MLFNLPMTSLLNGAQRAKLDPSDDCLFYEQPRFVTHVDELFIAQLTDLYRQRLKPGSRILDLMSSWISHLPEEIQFAEVIGHGLNAQELQRNSRLDHWFVQNLNQRPQLPLSDASVDAVLIAVSVQYLQAPEAVFQEIRRVLCPGGQILVSFSNRMFFQKAIQAWCEASEPERVRLVCDYVRATPGFGPPETLINVSRLPPMLQWLGLGGSDPFYAVVASAVEF
jgi:SAM-dependent methyltransferase